ncbi:hypothetical protein PENSPDRAFT_235311 [Peniophora sp. CONT]|nr:hypothetical protein PENSPDRAFT_235311 [Peniophora sp. CONT]
MRFSSLRPLHVAVLFIQLAQMVVSVPIKTAPGIAVCPLDSPSCPGHLERVPPQAGLDDCTQAVTDSDLDTRGVSLLPGGSRTPALIERRELEEGGSLCTSGIVPLKLRAADEPKFQLFDDKGNPLPPDFLKIYGQEKAVSFEQAPGGAVFGRVNTDEHI